MSDPPRDRPTVLAMLGCRSRPDMHAFRVTKPKPAPKPALHPAPSPTPKRGRPPKPSCPKTPSPKRRMLEHRKNTQLQTPETTPTRAGPSLPSLSLEDLSSVPHFALSPPSPSPAQLHCVPLAAQLQSIPSPPLPPPPPTPRLTPLDRPCLPPPPPLALPPPLLPFPHATHAPDFLPTPAPGPSRLPPRILHPGTALAVIEVALNMLATQRRPQLWHGVARMLAEIEASISTVVDPRVGAMREVFEDVMRIRDADGRGGEGCFCRWKEEWPGVGSELGIDIGEDVDMGTGETGTGGMGMGMGKGMAEMDGMGWMGQGIFEEMEDEVQRMEWRRLMASRPEDLEL